MTRKVKFIAFSDIQIEDWPRHSLAHNRFFHNKVILSCIERAAITHKCKNILFTGDLFDNPKYLKNFTLNYVFRWFNRFRDKGIKIIGISGNHDQSEKNTPEHESPSYMTMMQIIYDNVTCLDNTFVDIQGYNIGGIPYLSGNVGFTEALDDLDQMKDPDKKSILMLHTDLWGATDGYNREVGTVENIPRRMGKLFKNWDLVISGHIHKYQKLGKNIYMLGATHHQRANDEGVKMGYFLIYDDLSIEAVPLNMPEFKTINEGDPQLNNDFYIVKPKKVKKKEGEVKFKNTTNSVKLAKRYMKKEGEKNKKKLNTLIKYLDV